MIQPGQTLQDQSSYTVVVQGTDSQALLRDQWGLYYVTDTTGTVQYAGQSETGAEAELWVQNHTPCPYVEDHELWTQVVGPDIPFMAKEKER